MTTICKLRPIRLNGTELRVPTLVGSRIEGKGQPDYLR